MEIEQIKEYQVFTDVGNAYLQALTREKLYIVGGDRILSTTSGAEPPRDARDSGSARSHSRHLETSSSDRP